MWEPPSGFARRVLTRTNASGYSRPARVSILDVIFGGQRAVVSATFAYAGGWVVWQLTPPLIDRAMTAVDACAMFGTSVAAAMAANTSVVAWASAACVAFHGGMVHTSQWTLVIATSPRSLQSRRPATRLNTQQFTTRKRL